MAQLRLEGLPVELDALIEQIETVLEVADVTRKPSRYGGGKELLYAHVGLEKSTPAQAESTDQDQAGDGTATSLSPRRVTTRQRTTTTRRSRA